MITAVTQDHDMGQEDIVDRFGGEAGLSFVRERVAEGRPQPWPQGIAPLSTGWRPAAANEDPMFAAVRQLGRFDDDKKSLSPSAIRRAVLAARWQLMHLRFREGFARIEGIERRLTDLPPGTAWMIRQEVGLLRALGLALQDNPAAALGAAAALLADPAGPMAAAICRFCHWQLGHPGGPHALPWSERWPAFAGQRGPADILSLIVDAATELRHLHLSAARRTAMDALGLAETLARPEPALTALAAGIAAQALYEQGQDEEAEALVFRRLEAVNAETPLDCVWQVHLVLARIAAGRKHYDFALLLLRQAETLGLKRGWNRLVAACLGERLALLLRAERLREAEFCAARLDRFAAGFASHTGEPAPAILRHRDLALARLALATGEAPAALATFRRLHTEAIARHDLHLAFQLGLQMATALDRLGRLSQADALMLKALRLGAALGVFRLFADEGPAVSAIVRRVYENALGPASAARDILTYAASLVGQDGAPLKPSKSSGGGRSYISAREYDILALVAQGLSNKRIAQSLKIAPETVKSHIKRIFSKLAVKTRAEAVARADALGLL